MDFENVVLEKSVPLATLTVNRPAVLNALDRKTIEEIECAFFDIKNDDSIAVVIVTGGGPKAFIAGADISEIAGYDATSGAAFAHRGQAVLDLIENLGKPVIAAINGYALGGGMEIAMACHLRVACEGAKMGQPEIKLGVIPGFGGTQRLARLVGEGRAMQLVLTGEQIKAEQAAQMGLVNKVVPAERLMESARELALEIASMSGPVVGYAMQAVHGGLQVPLAEGLRLEANLFGLCCATDDKREGTRAFLEKRKPEFKNK